jgi:adenylate cyclase
MALSAYLPQDRLRALAKGEQLPGRTSGAALFADISGFTLLTEQLTRTLGARRGIESLVQQINNVYDLLIAEVERCDGSVIEFAGDAITCWFDEREGPSAARAAACAQAMQTAMRAFADVSIKIAVSTGPARRFSVGDPGIQLIDALAGATVARLAAAEQLARPGEIILDEATAAVLQCPIREWRRAETGGRFALLEATLPPVTTAPAEAPAAPSVAADVLKPWLLPIVYERETQGHGLFLAELRPTTAVFVRFTGIDYDQDEAAEEKLNAIVRQAQAILARHEGALLQLSIGDKGSYFYASLGALLAHEDDTRRAVRAALEIAQQARRFSFLQSIQIGLSGGTMRAGAYGSATRQSYGALGDDVNLAARLMTLAAPGEILVSGHAQQAVADSFTFEPRPPLVLKGKAEPLPVFVVTGPRQQRAIRLQEPTYTLPMVGRDKEFQAVSGRMDLALQGQGQVVGIVAEAGLGKSRLVAEVIRAARRKGFVGYGGACQSDGINRPYLAWKPIWSAFFDADPSRLQRKLLRGLESEIADRAPQRAEALPLLGQVLDLPLPIADNDFTQTLEPQTRKTTLHALLEDCLKAAAREGPILLVIEDLHWIDALSLDLLEELARAMTALPICFLLAYRAPQLTRPVAPRLEALPNFVKIELAELSPAECGQAIRAKLAQLYPARGGGLPPRLVEALMARAQGNPFYLEELLNFLRDRGLDPHNPATLDKIELPDSLHALILSRIDQLTEGQKTTLRVASIIGRMFRAGWLTGYYPVSGGAPQVKTDLNELQRLDITPLDTLEPEPIYLFKHIVTHEVTYASLPSALRARLHEQLAAYLERSAQTRPGASLTDTIAHHYGQSTNKAKQREYFQKAGEAAKASFANDAALDYYARLLPLLTGPAELADLHLQWSAVLERMGQWDEAETHGQAALAQAAADAGQNARCQFELGKLRGLRGDYAAALDWLERACSRFEALGDRARVGQALIEIGILCNNKGDYSAARGRLQAGLALAREAGDRRAVALALNVLGSVADSQGDYAGARTLYEEGLTLRREIGDQEGIAVSLNNLGSVARALGDYAGARRLYEESLGLKRDMGDKMGISVSLSSLGLVAYAQSDYTAAEALFAESLTLYREMGHKLGIAKSLTNLGLVYQEQGDNATARARFDESLALYRVMDSKSGIAQSLNNLGLEAMSRGDNAAAQALFDDCLALCREMDDKYGMAMSFGNLGIVAYSLGDNAAARALHEKSLALRREIADKRGVAMTLLNLGIVAWRLGDAISARALFDESLQLHVEMDDKLGIVYDLLGLAGVASREGASGRAVRLLAAAEALRAAIQLEIASDGRLMNDETTASAKAALGEAAFTDAWAEGERLTLAEATALAMQKE